MSKRTAEFYDNYDAYADDVADYHIKGYVKGLSLGKGIPRLEQLRAASRETGVTISEKMSGKTVHDLGFAAIEAATDEDLGQVVARAAEKPIFFDMTPKNILYDQKDHFGLIDYGKEQHTDPDRFFYAMQSAASSLVSESVGPYRTPEIIKSAHALTGRKITFLDRFEQIGRRELSASDIAKISMGNVRRSLEEELAQTVDPEYIRMCVQNWAEHDAAAADVDSTTV